MFRYFLVFCCSFLIGTSMHANDIASRIKNCLLSCYALDMESTDLVINKMQPLIQNKELHTLLDEFITLSEKHLKNYSGKSTELQDLPDDDAVKAAPASHTILSENDRVRILWAISHAGEQIPMHRHYWKCVFINLEESIFEGESQDGTKVVYDDPIGVDDLPADKQAEGYKNLGKTSSFLRFEIK